MLQSHKLAPKYHLPLYQVPSPFSNTVNQLYPNTKKKFKVWRKKLKITENQRTYYMILGYWTYQCGGDRRTEETAVLQSMGSQSWIQLSDRTIQHQCPSSKPLHTPALCPKLGTEEGNMFRSERKLQVPKAKNEQANPWAPGQLSSVNSTRHCSWGAACFPRTGLTLLQTSKVKIWWRKKNLRCEVPQV